MLFTSHPQNDHQYILRRRPSPRLETRHAYHGGLLFDGHRGTLTCSICDSTYFRRVGGCGNRDCVMSRFAPNLHPPNMCYYLVHRGSQPPITCAYQAHTKSPRRALLELIIRRLRTNHANRLNANLSEVRRKAGNRVAEIVWRKLAEIVGGNSGSRKWQETRRK